MKNDELVSAVPPPLFRGEASVIVLFSFIVPFHKQIGACSKLAILPLISKLQRITNTLVVL